MSGIQWDQADKSDSSKTQRHSNSVSHSAERRTSLTHKRRTSLGRRMKSPTTRNTGPQSPDADKKEEASRSIISPPASMRRSMLEKSQFKSPPPLAQGQAQYQKSPQEPRQTPHRLKSSLAKSESTSDRKRRQSRSPSPKVKVAHSCKTEAEIVRLQVTDAEIQLIDAEDTSDNQRKPHCVLSGDGYRKRVIRT